MARRFKFCISEVDEWYILCSENKGTDQLHVYRSADLCLCFSNMQEAGLVKINTSRGCGLSRVYPILFLSIIISSSKSHRFRYEPGCEKASQLSMKFKLLINIKIAKFDGIFKFKSLKPVIYPTNECLNANNFNIYYQDKFHAQLS